MITITRSSFAALVAVIFVAGCSQDRRADQSPSPTQASTLNTKPQASRLSTVEVIRIAKQTAERQGAVLGDYMEPVAHYDPTGKERRWRVYFEGRVPRPANHFSVSVDDTTGEARFLGGK